jgi:hypothetical protein
VFGINYIYDEFSIGIFQFIPDLISSFNNITDLTIKYRLSKAIVFKENFRSFDPLEALFKS